jgi:DNA repair exonuclease SbcCD ATPase subunit
MKREFLRSIEGLSDEAIDKIMAENGKDVEAIKGKLTATEAELQKSKESFAQYEAKIAELESKSSSNTELKKQFEELQAKVAAEKEAAEKAKADETLTNNIITAFGDKKFVNDYTKKSLIAEIKEALAKPENTGKGIEKIFTELTKDKEGIFENPNRPPDMPPMGEVDTSKLNDNKIRAVMGLDPK